MPTTNARKHTIPAGGDKSFNRATIFEAFGNSIHDVVPVASVLERTQLVSALNAKGVGPSPTNPVVVLRGDARGLHRIEYCMESTGTIWLPASGVLDFANKSAADSFGSANPGLLTAGDRCRISGTEWRWTGTKWVPDGNGLIAAAQVMPPSLILTTAMTEVAGLSLTGCPTGVPAILDVTLDAINGGSGSSRWINIRPYNGTTAIDQQRQFALPLVVNAGNQYTINYPVYITPTADTFTLQLSVDQNSSVVLRQAELRLTLRP